MRKEQGR